MMEAVYKDFGIPVTGVSAPPTGAEGVVGYVSPEKQRAMQAGKASGVSSPQLDMFSQEGVPQQDFSLFSHCRVSMPLRTSMYRSKGRKR